MDRLHIKDTSENGTLLSHRIFPKKPNPEHLHTDQKPGPRAPAGPRMALQNFNPQNPMDASLKEVRPYDQDVLRAMEREVQEMM